jgi:ATP-binding cassette subfamily B protein
MQLDPVGLQYDGKRPWRTLMHLYWPERRPMALALLSYLFKASPVWILPVITANIIDILAHRRADGLHVLWINAAIGAVAILQNIPSAAFYVNFLSRCVRNVEVRLRSSLVRRLQMLSIGYHNRTDTGVLQTKVTRDVESIEMMIRQIVDVGFFAVVTILVALCVTAWRMPAFVPVFILFVPLIWIVRRLTIGKMRRYNENLRKEVEGMNSLVLGMINMIPITRAHAVEDEEVARLESRFTSVRAAARSFDFVAGTFGATAWVILMIFNLAGFTAAAVLSYKGLLPLTAGDIVLLAGYFNTIMAAVMQLNAMLPIITRGFDALRSIGEVIECPDVEENRGKRVVEKIRGEFAFENVSFVYEKKSDTPPALREINFNVAAGETVGIVGPSGSGKSTLASLITGFHRPTTGWILLDGVDMNTIDLRSFRQHLAVVSQQTILFNGTLRENISYGLRDVTDPDLRRAIEDANAAEFIVELPKGVETEIGSNGVQLSGGQKQRIAIARALLRDPRVLILDEATSSLDTESESIVQQALERLMTGRTTFIIAHRHAVLRRADRILTFDRGTLVMNPLKTEDRSASTNRMQAPRELI